MVPTHPAPQVPLLDDVLHLAELSRPAWADISASIPAWHPRNEEADGGNADGAADGGSGDDGDAADDAGTTAEDDGAGDDPLTKTAEEYRKELRNYERTSKKAGERARKEVDELRKQLKAFQDRDKSDQEKAIEAARAEGRNEALTQSQQERRQDRLESAVTRLAAKGVQVGEGDDAKTLRFEDPEDALVFIERQIARGDIDADEVFDDQHKVQTDVLESALVELLERKPRLAAGGSDNGAAKTPPPKEVDQGKGKGSGLKDLESMTPEDHLKAIQQERR